MDICVLAVELGSLTSYAKSRDVPFVSVAFCDTAAHDAGFVFPDDIFGGDRVDGFGGMVLQPGIRFLEQARFSQRRAHPDHYECRVRRFYLPPTASDHDP